MGEGNSLWRTRWKREYFLQNVSNESRRGPTNDHLKLSIVCATGIYVLLTMLLLTVRNRVQ